MRIYLDEDMAGGLLIRLLEQVGHDVSAPAAVNMLGCSDAAQLTHAIHENRVCLTANYEDYQELHELVQEAHGTHAGILVVRQEDNPARKMTPKGIVAAIRKLEAAGVPIANEHTILNHWR
jgi:hypothetical protein